MASSHHLESEVVTLSRIEYRTATFADCPALAVLKGKVWNTTYKGVYSNETLQNYNIEKNQRIFESIVANPDIELYVATDGDVIVGFMTCGKPFRPFKDYRQEIGLLYILQSHQRRGIGRAFFAIAREQFRCSNQGSFIVSVNRQNHGALAFYRAMGGVPVHQSENQIRLAFPVES